MIVDITGTELIPGNQGKDCPGNGLSKENLCCCDECDYMLCCLADQTEEQCILCTDQDCPRSVYNRKGNGNSVYKCF